MERERVDSSGISSVGYSKESAVLELEFSSGKVYRYFAVPSSVHAELMKAESKGTFFNQRIKDVFPFARI